MKDIFIFPELHHVGYGVTECLETIAPFLKSQGYSIVIGEPIVCNSPVINACTYQFQQLLRSQGFEYHSFNDMPMTDILEKCQKTYKEDEFNSLLSNICVERDMYFTHKTLKLLNADLGGVVVFMGAAHSYQYYDFLLRHDPLLKPYIHFIYFEHSMSTLVQMKSLYNFPFGTLEAQKQLLDDCSHVVSLMEQPCWSDEDKKSLHKVKLKDVVNDFSVTVPALLSQILNLSQFIFQYPPLPITLKNFCAKCGKESSKRCSVCKATYFCSVDCQKAYWPTHKLFCKPSSA